MERLMTSFGITSLVRCIPLVGPTLVVVLSFLLYVFVPWMLETPLWMRMEIVCPIAEAWLKGFVMLGISRADRSVIVPLPPFNAWWAAAVQPDTQACGM